MSGNNPNVFFQEDLEGEQIRTKFLSFLQEFCFRERENSREIYVYRDEAEKMMKNKRTTIYVDFRHLIDHAQDFDLAEAVHMDFYKYEPFIQKAVQAFMYDLYPDFSRTKIFYIAFYNLHEVNTIRDLKSVKISKLMSIIGTITKTTEVRPELRCGSFKCDICGTITKDVEQQFRYTLPKLCVNKVCTNKTRFDLDQTDSIYTDWQKLRVQENSNDIPAGSMPRSIDVIVRNEQVEKGQPGDRCIFVGTLVVVPDVYSMFKPGEKYTMSSNVDGQKVNGNDTNNTGMQGVTGLKSLGVRDLNYKMLFMCNNVLFTENRFDSINIRDDDEREILENMTEAEKQEILQIKAEPNLYHRMAKSLCPMVFGNDEIKKGILLMLFGGVNKTTQDNTKLRGDINCCIVGDPSTAKSQFLKYVHGFLPRSVYTSGKATSAAG